MPLRNAVYCLVAALLGVALGACSSIGLESKKIDYKSATKLPPLEVPPDLIRPGADDRLTVPDVNPKSTATFSEYDRERTGQRTSIGSIPVLPQQGDARIERDGNQRWLVVKGTPDQVWPAVKDFWVETGFIVNLEIPVAGVMETDWAENRPKLPDIGIIRGFLGRMLDMPYSSSERDKFRTRLERGSQPDTTEIYVSHRGMEEVYTSQSEDAKDTRWQPRPSDPNLEVEMLGRLMMRFGVEESRVKAQISTGVTTQPRAKLSSGTDGARTLALDEQFDRAWRRVGLALDRVGFTVEDRDRSKGLFFVRYIDPEADVQDTSKEGFLEKLKFWKSTPANKQPQYRIHVADAGASMSQVQVQDSKGAPDSGSTSKKILGLLYEQLK
jgi:outer membrane protein assembly factor BamC